MRPVSGRRRLLLQLDLPFAPGSPREARHAVAAQYQASPRCDDLLICVSEVVTNAVLHARSAPRLTLTQDGDIVRVEVRDADPALPVRLYHGRQRAHGPRAAPPRPATMAWGADPEADGKVVWFEFALSEAVS